MSLLTNPSDLKESAVFSGLIYGQPGIGKTTLALSAKNPVCIDADRGMKRVEKRFQVPSLQVENYAQVLDLINGPELAPFDTIVIDTLGKLIDRIGDYVCLENPKFRQGDGTLAMKGWGAVKIKFQQLVKLIQSKNKSVIFVAHESEEKDGDKTKKRPDCAGSARKDIVKELDFMGYMEAVGGKRTICFTPTDTFYAKNSCGLDGIIEIPDLKMGGANTFVQDKIAGAMLERQSRDNEMLESYTNLINVIDSKIQACESVTDLNTCKAELGNLEEIWDSKLRAWHLLKEKANSLNAEFDKESKLFVAKAV